MRPPRVFVTQETNHDFTDAHGYGEVIFLTHEDYNNISNGAKNADITRRVQRLMSDFDPSRDWLVVTGSPYVAGMAFMALGNNGVRSVNILRWDNRDFVYRPLFLKLQ